ANLGESFRVDKIPPEVGGFTDPTQNEWIDQRGTRFLDEATGDFIYKPNRKPAFKFKAARDNESLLAKYIVSLRVLNNSDTATLVADQALTPATNNDLFSLPFGTEYTFNPPWGTGTWPVELKDGRYRWEIKAIDNTYVNTAFYRGVAAPAQLYETFRLDTLPPTVAPNTVEPVRVSPTPNTTLDVATGIGVGQLLNPKYGDVTTVSVNLVYFNFSKAVDDINPSPCGQ
ncbi:MAG TPA: hypothetical protein PKL57_04365, partial [Candidatus Wallbacteria bacterium]|nr:hypothetical protein [Candidatus Wallbacteria bacterium]